MEIEQELKDKIKKARLNQYKAQVYTLEMDIVALRAVGDEASIEKYQEKINSLKAAHAAVEAM